MCKTFVNIYNHKINYMKILVLCIGLFYSITISAQINFEYYYHKSDSLVQLHVGEQFPAFSAKALNGKIISDKDLQGKVTIFNFWFQYCAPCIAEFDALNVLNHKFKDNPAFQFISFTSDSSEEATESLVKYKLSFPVCPITEKECFRLNFNDGFPSTILVDQSGKIVLIKSGGSLEKDKIEIDIQKLASTIDKLL